MDSIKPSDPKAYIVIVEGEDAGDIMQMYHDGLIRLGDSHPINVWGSFEEAKRSNNIFPIVLVSEDIWIDTNGSKSYASELGNEDIIVDTQSREIIHNYPLEQIFDEDDEAIQYLHDWYDITYFGMDDPFQPFPQDDSDAFFPSQSGTLPSAASLSSFNPSAFSQPIRLASSFQPTTPFQPAPPSQSASFRPTAPFQPAPLTQSTSFQSTTPFQPAPPSQSASFLPTTPFRPAASTQSASFSNNARSSSLPFQPATASRSLTPSAVPSNRFPNLDNINRPFNVPGAFSSNPSRFS